MGVTVSGAKGLVLLEYAEGKLVFFLWCCFVCGVVRPMHVEACKMQRHMNYYGSFT